MSFTKKINFHLGKSSEIAAIKKYWHGFHSEHTLKTGNFKNQSSQEVYICMLSIIWRTEYQEKINYFNEFINQEVAEKEKLSLPLLAVLLQVPGKKSSSILSQIYTTSNGNLNEVNFEFIRKFLWENPALINAAISAQGNTILGTLVRDIDNRLSRLSKHRFSLDMLRHAKIYTSSKMINIVDNGYKLEGDSVFTLNTNKFNGGVSNII